MCKETKFYLKKKIFDKNFIAVHQINPVLILNKPIYVGFCIKLLMYKFHYNYLCNIVYYDVFKISLNCFDDKRYVLNDGINTLASFHKDIKS